MQLSTLQNATWPSEKKQYYVESPLTSHEDSFTRFVVKKILNILKFEDLLIGSICIKPWSGDLPRICPQHRILSAADQLTLSERLPKPRNVGQAAIPDSDLDRRCTMID